MVEGIVFVIVDKVSDLVVGILTQLSPIGGYLRTNYDVYHEDAGTNVLVGYTCTVNQNGTRSYAP